MDNLYSTTKHVKNKHLKYKERVIIQTRLKDGWSPNKIAKEIGCAPNTIRNEIERGTQILYHGNIRRYKADKGQAVYEQNRDASRRNYKYLEQSKFISYVEQHFRRDNWSLDACVGYAVANKEFSKDEIVCTKTLYNYVNLGLIGIKNIDLPEKLRRSGKRSLIRKNKRKLGRSIEERDSSVDTRAEFGHWEADLVMGGKTKDDDALLTLLERKTRRYMIFRVPGREPKGVISTFDNLRVIFGEHWDAIFKTITTDNGSEFSSLSGIESKTGTLVYFTHPYTSCEKGSIERHNGFIRRFLPKGRRIKSYDDKKLESVEVWCNNLPRKLLGYKTPDELFEQELDKIYNSTN